jgi:hypothetical protein
MPAGGVLLSCGINVTGMLLIALQGGQPGRRSELVLGRSLIVEGAIAGGNTDVISPLLKGCPEHRTGVDRTQTDTAWITVSAVGRNEMGDSSNAGVNGKHVVALTLAEQFAIQLANMAGSTDYFMGPGGLYPQGYPFSNALATAAMTDDFFEAYARYARTPPRLENAKVLVYERFGSCPKHGEEAFTVLRNDLYLRGDQGAVQGDCDGTHALVVDASGVGRALAPLPPRKGETKYRWVLVAEGGKHGVTDVLLRAFASGGIPIYVGSPGAVQLFNSKAFVIFDPLDPNQCVKEIKRLERDADEYARMLKAPMLNEAGWYLHLTGAFHFMRAAASLPHRFIHFVSYAYGRDDGTRIRQEAEASQFFDTVRVHTQVPSASFATEFSDVLDLKHGGGYWIWIINVLRDALNWAATGDIIVYADVGSTINPLGRTRFAEYLSKLRGSMSGILQFKTPFPEHRWTTDAVFKHFKASPDDPRIGKSPQLTSSLIMVRATETSRRWLDKIEAAIRADSGLITDKYNLDTKKRRHLFVNTRHDQSILSVSGKIALATVAVDDSSPPGSRWAPFWRPNTNKYSFLKKPKTSQRKFPSHVSLESSANHRG